jgi:hypothetical protein
MRRKNLISPERHPEDTIQHKFKLLFLPDLSYAVAVTILGAFCFTIFALIQTQYLTVAITASLAFLLFGLLLQILVVFFLVKISDLILTSEEISGQDLRYHRNSIKWKEITFVKQYNLLGLRYLSIKTENNNNIQIPVCLYETALLLDRVRELAGEDHILVRALEKELSRPRYELTKLWIGVIRSIALSISIYLIGGNIYAAEQEKPLEQAISSYVRQHPKTAPNQSAIDLQTLMAKLGLSVDAFGDGTEVKVKPDKTAIAEWKAIGTILFDTAGKQVDKTEDSIESLPVKLSNYLKTHQTDIQAIETQLIDNPIPEWGSDSGWVERSDPKAGDSFLRSKPMNYLSIATIENIIIVNILDKLQVPNISISSDLAAFEKIQQSFQTQPSLVGQLVSRIGENRISKLVRKLDTVPTGWGDNLFSRDRHQKMYKAIENDSMITTRLLQSSGIFSEILNNFKSPSRFVPGYSQLIRPRVRLAAVDRDLEIKKGLAYWSKQNICRTDGKSDMKSTESVGLEDYRDLSFIPPLDLATQYPKVLKSDLLWELTTSITRLKAQLAAGGKINLVARKFNLPSKVCPGEQWTATVNNGAVEIAFSHPPDWKVLNTTRSAYVEPLTYRIKLIDRN